jgi:hypothetical protein
VALIFKIFVFVLPVLPSVTVNETVYVPPGNVTGKGVRRLELLFAGRIAVPEFVLKNHVTVVDAVMLLPVEINVNNTLEPAQTFN